MHPSPRPKRRTAYPLLVLPALLLGMTACGGSDDPTPSEPEPEVATIQVSPSDADLSAVGATVQLSAVARDAQGGTVSGVSFSWSSGASSVASVSATGLVTAVADGEATITASARGVSGSATVTVAQEVAEVTVDPAQASVEVGGTASFTAEALDANGNPVPDTDFTWASDDEAVATVDATGQATGVAQGSAEISATAEGLSGTATLSVVPEGQAPTMAQLSGDGQFGTTQEEYGSPLVVEVTDANGAPATGVTVTWAVAAGAGSLSASSTTTDGQGRASVTVTAGASTGDLVVEASSAEAEGGPVSFTLRTSVMAVQIEDNAFVDLQGRRNANFEAAIQVGDTIEFTYVASGSTTHTVTSTDTPSGGASFDSGSMSPGDTFRFTPQVVGTWTFFCAVHPNIMVDATIVVTDPGALLDEEGPGAG